MTHGQRRLAALLVSGVMLATSSVWAFSSTAGMSQRRRRHKKAQAKLVVAPQPPVPAPPTPPPVPMHETAVPPVVTYENGSLTIEAQNSTLSDVLQAVEKHTGAKFDIGSGDTSERVVGKIGPGTARDVLATLLNGSHFNYVMLSPLGNPSGLSRVLLTPRSSAPISGYTAQQQPIPQFQQPNVVSPLQQQPPAATEESSGAEAVTEDAADAQDTNDAATDNADQSTAQPGIPPPGVKTPEQLLQELRQQQQQVIQQQQQGNQQNPRDNN